MTGVPETAADRWFAALQALRQAVPDLTFTKLVRQAAGQRPPVSISAQRLSDWFGGKAVPADGAVVRFLVEYLQPRAARTGRYQSRPLEWWLDLHQRARQERQTGRAPQRRPADSPPAARHRPGGDSHPGQPVHGTRAERLRQLFVPLFDHAKVLHEVAREKHFLWDNDSEAARDRRHEDALARCEQAASAVITQIEIEPGTNDVTNAYNTAVRSAEQYFRSLAMNRQLPGTIGLSDLRQQFEATRTAVPTLQKMIHDCLEAEHGGRAPGESGRTEIGRGGEAQRLDNLHIASDFAITAPSGYTGPLIPERTPAPEDLPHPDLAAAQVTQLMNPAAEPHPPSPTAPTPAPETFDEVQTAHRLAAMPTPQATEQLLELDTGRAALVLARMDPAAAARRLEAMPHQRSAELLAHMDEELAAERLAGFSSSDQAAEALAAMTPRQAEGLLKVRPNHPATAEFLLRADPAVRAALLDTLPTTRVAGALAAMPTGQAAEQLLGLDTDRAALILDLIDPAAAAWRLEAMPRQRSAELLARLGAVRAARCLLELLQTWRPPQAQRPRMSIYSEPGYQAVVGMLREMPANGAEAVLRELPNNWARAVRDSLPRRS